MKNHYNKDCIKSLEDDEESPQAEETPTKLLK